MWQNHWPLCRIHDITHLIRSKVQTDSWWELTEMWLSVETHYGNDQHKPYNYYAHQASSPLFKEEQCWGTVNSRNKCQVLGGKFGREGNTYFSKCRTPQNAILRRAMSFLTIAPWQLPVGHECKAHAYPLRLNIRTFSPARKQSCPHTQFTVQLCLNNNNIYIYIHIYHGNIICISATSHSYNCLHSEYYWCMCLLHSHTYLRSNTIK